MHQMLGSSVHRGISLASWHVQSKREWRRTEEFGARVSRGWGTDEQGVGWKDAEVSAWMNAQTVDDRTVGVGASGGKRMDKEWLQKAQQGGMDGCTAAE
eukprot:scaffold2181_cov26-Tisochrysis_lutea.AAC.1